jgi:MFS family permease
MTLSYRWVLVAIGALVTCVAMGAMFSLAIFLEPIATSTGWSRAGISSGMTVNFIAMGIAGFAWGAANDRFGSRIVVLCGTVILGLGLVLASRATTLLEFQLVYGVLVGIASGAFVTPMIAATTGWFDKNRALAISLVSAGIGVAPMTISPFARYLISTYEWRSAMLMIGLFAWAVLLPAALFVRNAPQPPALAPGAPAAAGPQDDLWVMARQAFRTPQFLVLAGTFAACCAAHSGPIFHMVSYATLCGVSAMAAVSIYSVEGLAGLFGRLLLGVLADRYGIKLVLTTGLMVQALAIGSYLYVSKLEEFYLLAIVFGTAYGGVMPLYAGLAREYFGQAIIGTVLGAATMISCVGMAFGPFIGGWLFDTYHDYRWLFIGSMAVALGAVAISLAFPSPGPAKQLQPAGST